jgi:hypothetical protein
MAFWILQSSFEPRSALHRITELLARGSDELCVELGLSQEQERVRLGWSKDSSNRLSLQIDEIRYREELEKELRELSSGKSLLRFLGEEHVVAKQQKIKATLQRTLSRHEFIHGFYTHPRVWLAAYVRDAALDASRSSEAEWKSIEEYDDSLAPSASFLLKTDSDQAKKYMEFLKTDWSQLSPEFILKSMDGHRSLRFDAENKMVSFCESVPLPDVNL